MPTVPSTRGTSLSRAMGARIRGPAGITSLRHLRRVGRCNVRRRFARAQSGRYAHSGPGVFRMTFDEALHQLGVRDDTLTSAEKQRLDRDGFLPLERIITDRKSVV